MVDFRGGAAACACAGAWFVHEPCEYRCWRRRASLSPRWDSRPRRPRGIGSAQRLHLRHEGQTASQVSSIVVAGAPSITGDRLSRRRCLRAAPPGLGFSSFWACCLLTRFLCVMWKESPQRNRCRGFILTRITNNPSVQHSFRSEHQNAGGSRSRSRLSHPPRGPPYLTAPGLGHVLGLRIAARATECTNDPTSTLSMVLT